MIPLAEPFPEREPANQQEFIRNTTNRTIRVTIKSNLKITITASRSATVGTANWAIAAKNRAILEAQRKLMIVMNITAAKWASK